MPSLPVLLAVVFQLVWIVTALAAAQGLAWPGLTASAALVLLALAANQRRLRLLALVASCAFIGALCESALAASGLVGYAAGWPGHPSFAPLWLIALWAAFATTLPALLTVLVALPRLLIPALGGALGLASYLAGERLGALAFREPRIAGYTAVAFVWAAALPLMLTLQTQVAPRRSR